MNTSCILLVDDDQESLHSMRRAMRKQPFQLLLAPCGEDALRMLETNAVEVVVSDERMPSMSGSDLLARVATQYPDTVRIMLTGEASIEAAQRAINQGQVFRLLTKPVEPCELAQVIQDGLAERAKRTSKALVNADTGLPTEEALLVHLDCALKSNRRGSRCMLFLIGIERLRLLAGRLLPESAVRLSQMIAGRLKADASLTLDLNPPTSTLDLADSPEQDRLRAHSLFVAQATADEFAIVLEFSEQRDPSLIAGALSRSLERSFSLNGRTVFLLAQIGVVSQLSTYESATDAVRDARCALGNVRASRAIGQVEVFDTDIRSAADLQLELEADFKSALDDGDLKVYYQPIVEADTCNTVGVEALLRWRHPKYQWINAQHIVNIAEDLGLMHRLSMRILGAACRQHCDWRRRGRRIKMSVNISCSEFNHPKFAQHVLTTVEATSIEPAWLQLELTESVMIDAPERAMTAIAKLRAAGIGIALDDFGTGYSSLSYLRRIQPDTLKIDKSFVADILSDDVAAQMLEGIVDLARRLELRIVAEGVETEAQRIFLNQVGCQELQGYLFSKPVEAMALDDVLFTPPG